MLAIVLQILHRENPVLLDSIFFLEFDLMIKTLFVLCVSWNKYYSHHSNVLKLQRVFSTVLNRHLSFGRKS